jgi:hypothetical protein
MSNRSKILLILFLLALLTLAGLILEPKLFPKKDAVVKDSSSQASDFNSLKIEEAYRAQIKTEYEKVYNYLKESKNNASDLVSIRTAILALRVPTRFRDLHLELVLAIDRMENYEKFGKTSDKTESEKIINRLKTENQWL